MQFVFGKGVCCLWGIRLLIKPSGKRCFSAMLLKYRFYGYIAIF